jgi:hypothetical protein
MSALHTTVSLEFVAQKGLKLVRVFLLFGQDVF